MEGNDKIVGLGRLTKYDEKIKEYIKTNIGNIDKLTREKVDDVSKVVKENVIYMVPNNSGKSGNIYDEYMLLDGKVELIGSTKVDLSNYYTKEEIDAIVAKAGENVYYLDGVTDEVQMDEIYDRLVKGDKLDIYMINGDSGQNKYIDKCLSASVRYDSEINDTALQMLFYNSWYYDMSGKSKYGLEELATHYDLFVKYCKEAKYGTSSYKTKWAFHNMRGHEYDLTNDVVAKDNTTAWTPVQDYGLVHKKYVDDAIAGIGGSSIYKVSSIEEMNEIDGPSAGDYCVVQGPIPGCKNVFWQDVIPGMGDGLTDIYIPETFTLDPTLNPDGKYDGGYNQTYFSIFEDGRYKSTYDDDDTFSILYFLWGSSKEASIKLEGKLIAKIFGQENCDSYSDYTQSGYITLYYTTEDNITYTLKEDSKNKAIKPGLLHLWDRHLYFGTDQYRYVLDIEKYKYVLQMVYTSTEYNNPLYTYDGEQWIEVGNDTLLENIEVLNKEVERLKGKIGYGDIYIMSTYLYSSKDDETVTITDDKAKAKLESLISTHDMGHYAGVYLMGAGYKTLLTANIYRPGSGDSQTISFIENKSTELRAYDDYQVPRQFVLSCSGTWIGKEYKIDEITVKTSPLTKKPTVLTTSNTKEFIPENDYEPSTKKYVDDEINTLVNNFNDILVAKASYPSKDYFTTVTEPQQLSWTIENSAAPNNWNYDEETKTFTNANAKTNARATNTKATLTITEACKNVKIEVSLSTQSSDKFTLKVNDATIVNKGGTYSEVWEGDLVIGDKIVLQYLKDSSVDSGSDLCTIKISYPETHSYEVLNKMPSILSTGIDYEEPYEPEFDGSPATKKYVDDLVAKSGGSSSGNIEWCTDEDIDKLFE